MKRTGFLCLALVAVLSAGCSNERRDTAANRPAGDAVGTSGAADKNLSRSDKDFLTDAATANMAEIELARLTNDHAANAEVKTFAQMMIDDHTKALNDLKALASTHSIALPTALDDKHNDLRDKLSKAQGNDFDRDYTKTMVDGHQDFVDKLESRIDKTKLADWKKEMAERGSKGAVMERGQLTAVTPEKSDNPITMAINEWAAKTYPVAYAHMEAAKALDKTVRNRSTN